MSHKTKPYPRQNVHRGRKPRTEPQAGRAPSRKPNKANSQFNQHAQRASAPGAVASAGQLAATIKLS